MHNKSFSILMFDLPSLTKEEKKGYNRFRKFLKRHGYIQLQESIYIKLLRSSASFKYEVSAVEREAPDKGNVILLPLSSEQCKRMVLIKGKSEDIMQMFGDIIVA